MVPEYLTYRFTGKMENEYTNATTTGLVNARTKTWDGELLDRLGYPRRLFGELRQPASLWGDLPRRCGSAWDSIARCCFPPPTTQAPPF